MPSHQADTTRRQMTAWTKPVGKKICPISKYICQFDWLGVEGLLDVRDDIVRVLDTDRETDQVRGHAAFLELLVA